MEKYVHIDKKSGMDQLHSFTPTTAKWQRSGRLFNMDKHPMQCNCSIQWSVTALNKISVTEIGIVDKNTCTVIMVFKRFHQMIFGNLVWKS